jgi:DNA-binding LacI/PurR family transcriptional regulator
MTVLQKTKVTMADIAESCGISPTAVSFVLRGRDMGISDVTHEQILQQAVALNYKTRPDQRIDSHKVRVLMLVPSYDNIYNGDRYYCRMLANLAAREEASGVQVVVQASANRDITRSLYKGICEDSVDIVMPISLGVDELERVIRISPVPVVVPEVHSNTTCSCIGHDSAWIGEEAARQFFQAGHRRAAVLAADVLQERVEHFERVWMSLTGTRPEIYNLGSLNMESVHDSAMDIFEGSPEFTALFCVSDSVAMGALQAIHDRGRHVPSDISIIGCDDDSASRFAHPSLSTFCLDETEHCDQLIAEFKRLASGGPGTVAIANKPAFIRRQSLRNV